MASLLLGGWLPPSCSRPCCFACSAQRTYGAGRRWRHNMRLKLSGRLVRSLSASRQASSSRSEREVIVTVRALLNPGIALGLAVVLSGCVLLVEPIIPESDATFDPRLLGTWE